MSQHFEGVVERITETAGRYGSMYAFIVDNVRHGTKSRKPACREGDYVEFNSTQNGNFWDADANSIKAKAQPDTPPPTAAATKTKAWEPDTSRQDSIVYQSSRKDALEFVKLLVQAGCVDMGKAKKADQIELMESYVDRYTSRFIEDVTRLSPPKTVDQDLEEMGNSDPFAKGE